MPSPMIHLLVAHEVNPNAPALFWVGNFAPDYVNERELKDKIHFRDSLNRLGALSKLRNEIDISNPFEEGWLLHLFTDLCWDEQQIPLFKEKCKKNNTISDWFIDYRKETTLASFYIYHNFDWSSHVWSKILNANLQTLSSTLPVTQADIELYRERLYKRHSDSTSTSYSFEYHKELLTQFSKETAKKYVKWLEIS